MNKPSFGKSLAAYLRDHRLWAAMFIACVGVFSIMCALFALPAAVIWYALILCALILLPVVIFDFTRFFHKHALLCRLAQTRLRDMRSLPAPTRQLESDYQALLSSELTRGIQAESAAAALQRNQMDDYALWTHQIKVPISAMHLLLQAQQGESRAQLTGELFKIEQYVDMALNYVRLNGISTDYVLKTHSLNDIIRQTLRKFAPLFIQKKLKLAYEPTTLMVLTDEKWLSFAIEQLLSNAVKYTKRGCITIRVDDDAQALMIEDTGIGISPEDLPRIFERGYTGYNGRDDKRATGLGLYLCRQSLERIGHTVSITSALGRGTCAAISLGHVDIQME